MTQDTTEEKILQWNDPATLSHAELIKLVGEARKYERERIVAWAKEDKHVMKYEFADTSKNFATIDRDALIDFLSDK